MKKTSIFFAATIMVVAASCQKGLEDNNAPAVYYNLQGVKVAEPSNGIFIKVQGKKVSKVYVK